jgi:hypothetical protein
MWCVTSLEKGWKNALIFFGVSYIDILLNL